MYALHLPSRHAMLMGLFALILAMAFIVAADAFSHLDLNLFSGGGAATDPTPVPPASWATDPLSPPTVLLMH
jgi:hypothetical protein